MTISYELCPYCNSEVELKNARKMIPQKCPVCKKSIMPCNLCSSCDNSCGKAVIKEQSIPNDCLKKGYHWYIDETFKAVDNDKRIAVLLDDCNGELVDWYFFDTREQAVQFIKDEYKEQGVECPSVL